MRSLGVFIALALGVASASEYKLPTPPQCGNMEGDLAEGNAVTLTEFPWTSFLTYGSTSRGFISCTGVMISRSHVMTFEVCLKTHEYALYFWPGLYLGFYDWTTQPLCVVGQCKSNRVPYKAQSANDGLVVLRVPWELTLDNTTRPICLPSAVESYTPSAPNDTLYLTGWGKPSLGEAPDAVKVKRIMTVLDTKDCETRTSKTIGDNEFCIEGDNTGCFGFLGAPLMKKVGESWVLESMFIDNTACWEGRSIFVVPKIKAREEWIESILDKLY